MLTCAFQLDSASFFWRLWDESSWKRKRKSWREKKSNHLDWIKVRGKRNNNLVDGSSRETERIGNIARRRRCGIIAEFNSPSSSHPSYHSLSLLHTYMTLVLFFCLFLSLLLCAVEESEKNDKLRVCCTPDFRGRVCRLSKNTTQLTDLFGK